MLEEEKSFSHYDPMHTYSEELESLKDKRLMEAEDIISEEDQDYYY